MPIYHLHRIAHIHIPKTGGTAIESHFHEIGDMEWGRASWLGREQRNGRWYELQHLTWLELRELSGLPLDSYKSIAVVRDPYSRMLSDFLWRRRIVKLRPQSTIRSFESFRDFLLAIPPDLDTRWSEYADGADREETNFLIHVRPQHHYVFDQLGNRQVDNVIRFENLDRELDRVLDGCGLNTSRIRRPPQRNLRAFYDRKLLDRVYDLYLKDFDHFGYARI